MTLQEFFDACAENPTLILFYFIFIPVAAVITGMMSKGEGHLSPFKYLFSALIYLVTVPGIFAITLNIYLFLFESRPIMETDLFLQVLPILSMIATLFIIKKFVPLDYIPGFGKLSGLFLMIFAVLFVMWIIDRTHIFVVAFTRMPFYVVLLIFVAMLALFRLGFKRVVK